MHLSSGIPTVVQLKSLQETDLYRQHVEFNRAFLEKHADAMSKYGSHWGLDPFKLWSRRWEYPYAAQRLIEFGQARTAPMKVLDAGSGVTYFPYFVISQLPQTEFICCDYDDSYAPMFDDINAARGNPRVRFVEAALQQLPLEKESLDAICCISVLEHTDNYGEIVREFARVLKPGGLFILTYDLSLDGKFTLPKALAEQLMGYIAQDFSFIERFDAQRELSRISEPGILETKYIRVNEPQMLPWSRPVRIFKAAQDLVQGRGWTGGFRWRTVVCLAAVKNGLA